MLVCFISFLKTFYDATLSFFGSLHVTANTFFKKLVSIQKSLNKWRHSDDLVIQRMTTNMQLKFNKYWESGGINYLLLIDVFYPHYKCEYIQFCFNRMSGVEKSMEMMKKLKELIHKLIQQYVLEHSISYSISNSANSSTLASNMASQRNDDNNDKDDEFRMKMKKKQGEVQKNELDRYLEDDVEDDHVEFDILNWWKSKASKYYIFSCMTRDILVILVSTV